MNAEFETRYDLETLEFRIKFDSSDEKKCLVLAIHELTERLYNFKNK